MKIWIDAHLSPGIATWITMTLGITAIPLRDLGLRDAEDTEIFALAKAENVILMTKDSDFIELVNRLGSPPKVIWLTYGNTSNSELRKILKVALPQVMIQLQMGKDLVEIDG